MNNLIKFTVDTIALNQTDYGATITNQFDLDDSDDFNGDNFHEYTMYDTNWNLRWDLKSKPKPIIHIISLKSNEYSKNAVTNFSTNFPMPPIKENFPIIGIKRK